MQSEYITHLAGVKPVVYTSPIDCRVCVTDPCPDPTRQYCAGDWFHWRDMDTDRFHRSWNYQPNDLQKCMYCSVMTHSPEREISAIDPSHGSHSAMGKYPTVPFCSRDVHARAHVGRRVVRCWMVNCCTVGFVKWPKYNKCMLAWKAAMLCNNYYDILCWW